MFVELREPHRGALQLEFLSVQAKHPLFLGRSGFDLHAPTTSPFIYRSQVPPTFFLRFKNFVVSECLVLWQFRSGESVDRAHLLYSRVYPAHAGQYPKTPTQFTMDNEIKLTPASKIVDMTKALPEVPNGDYPRDYDQVIRGNASASADAQRGKPDPSDA